MSQLLFHSRRLAAGASGALLEIAPQVAGWEYIHFQVRQLASGAELTGSTGTQETCFVLLKGEIQLTWEGEKPQSLGPRKNVFDSYPHAAYLPIETGFQIVASQPSQLAQASVPSRKRFQTRLIRPNDCGYEIRGGGNATRQIIDILPPSFPADRLMACEVYTPSGNWSSYPPHKHDEEDPPGEVDLEEIYYYRFSDPWAYGFQRLYTGDGSQDETIKVIDGDLVLVKEGYHPFVTAYGYDAYYLNFLAGHTRSMAARDDPAYKHFRDSWPDPDPRLPLLVRPDR